jgi:hypothetical protein
MVRFPRRIQGPLLGYFVSKVAATLGSSILGVGVCFAFIWLSQALGMSVRFPSPGGEDDFSLRALYFLFGVCPAFLLLGAWIGHAGFGSVRRWMLMWGGALIGAVLVFTATRLLQTQIELLSSDRTANYAVLAFYIAWVVSSALGAVVVRRMHSR